MNKEDGPEKKSGWVLNEVEEKTKKDKKRADRVLYAFLSNRRKTEWMYRGISLPLTMKVYIHEIQ